MRDTVNTLQWRVMLGQSESGMHNFASKNNKNIVLCTKLKLITSSRNFPRT